MEYTVLLVLSYASLLVTSFLFNKRLSKIERLIHRILYYIPCAVILFIYSLIFLIMYSLNMFLTSRLFFKPMRLEDCPVGEENRISSLLSPLDLLFQVSDKDFVSADGLFRLKGEFSIAKFKDALIRDFAFAKNSKGRLLYPKLTQVVRERNLYATWEYCPNFNIDKHVTEKWIDLNAPEDLRKFLTEVNMKRIPPHRPGFQFYVLHDKHTVQYTEDTMTYVVYRLDHTLGDGLTFVMNSLGKPSTEEDRTKLEGLFNKFDKSPSINFRNLLLLFFLSPLYLSDFLELEPANMFKSKINTHLRHIAQSPPLDFKKISAIKRRTKTSVNDVFIMLLGQALQSYIEEKGNNPANTKFVSFVQATSSDVSLVGNSNMSNNFVGVRIKIPLRITDWRGQLNEINSAMLELKSSLMPLFCLMLVLAVSYMPKYVRILSQRLIFYYLGTGALFNVPGPDVNMSLVGVPIDGIAVYLPLAVGLPFGSGFITYGQEVNVTITTDGSVCADPERIIEHLIRRLDEIYKSVSPSF